MSLDHEYIVGAYDDAAVRVYDVKLGKLQCTFRNQTFRNDPFTSLTLN
jgi:hypothetical protein